MTPKKCEPLRRSVVLQRRSVAMNEKSDRAELQRRLDQAKRMATFSGDPVTSERLQKAGARVGGAASQIGVGASAGSGWHPAVSEAALLQTRDCTSCDARNWRAHLQAFCGTRALAGTAYRAFAPVYGRS
jgi:hypothetical protein